MINSLYYVQVGLFEFLTFLLLLAAASTSLAQLFLPAVQRQPHHLSILRMVGLTDILQILHQLDPYAVFGIYSTALAHLFQVQVTSMLFYTCSFSLAYNFESLFNLMQRSRPWYIRPLLWTVPILHHVIRTIATCFEFTIDLNTASADFLARFTIIRSITSIAVCGCLIFFSVLLVVQLAFTVRSFIRKLEHLEKKEANDAAAYSAGISQPKASDIVTEDNLTERVNPLPVNSQQNTLVISGIRTRIMTMRHAARQVILGTLGINCVLMATFAVNSTRLGDIAHNTFGRGEFVVTDPSTWVWRGCAVHVLQMISLALFTWYTWRSPMLWLRSPYSFMSTMSFGVEYAAAQAARAARVAQDPNTPSTEPLRLTQRGVCKALTVDSATPKSGSQGLPSPSPLLSPRMANEDKVIIVCASPRGVEDPQAQKTDLICPVTVQSTTRHLPIPPYNSTVEGTILLKHDSQLPPIYEQHRSSADLDSGCAPFELPPGVLFGESKLVVNREDDQSRMEDLSVSKPVS